MWEKVFIFPYDSEFLPFVIYRMHPLFVWDLSSLEYFDCGGLVYVGGVLHFRGGIPAFLYELSYFLIVVIGGLLRCEYQCGPTEYGRKCNERD